MGCLNIMILQINLKNILFFDQHTHIQQTVIDHIQKEIKH